MYRNFLNYHAPLKTNPRWLLARNLRWLINNSLVLLLVQVLYESSLCQRIMINYLIKIVALLRHLYSCIYVIPVIIATGPNLKYDDNKFILPRLGLTLKQYSPMRQFKNLRYNKKKFLLSKNKNILILSKWEVLPWHVSGRGYEYPASAPESSLAVYGRHCRLPSPSSYMHGWWYTQYRSHDVLPQGEFILDIVEPHFKTTPK